MARPKKAGLDFYYRDVNELDDYRRIMLMEQYGPIGNTVFDIIADRIYRDGYYLEVPLKQLSVHIMRIIGGQWIDNIGQIIDIIRYCGEIGLLSKELLAQSVITSEDFQRNYSYVSARRKADRSKYWLLPLEEEKEAVSAEETPVIAAETPVIAAETPIIAEEAPVSAAQTPIIAAETPIPAAQTPIHATIIPQSREEQSRADTEQKRINEMMAEQTQTQSKAKRTQNQKPRRSADEIFGENESESGCAAAAAAASRNHAKKNADAAADTGTGEPDYAAPSDWYKDTYEYTDSGYTEACEYGDAKDTAYSSPSGYEKAKKDHGSGRGECRDYRTIDSAFYAAVGRYLEQTDKENIEELRREGADDSLIVAVLRKVAARKGAKEIHSFRYFMPAIREKLSEQKTAWGKKENTSAPLGYILYGFDPDGPYANCTADEEYLAVLDREFGVVPQEDEIS